MKNLEIPIIDYRERKKKLYKELWMIIVVNGMSNLL